MLVFTCLLFILAPKQAWAELTSHGSPEQRSSTNPENSNQKEQGADLTACFVLFQGFSSTPAMLRGCLVGEKAAANFRCPPFFPSPWCSAIGWCWIFSSHTSWAVVPCMRGTVPPFLCGQHIRSSIPTSAYLLDQTQPLFSPR